MRSTKNELCGFLQMRIKFWMKKKAVSVQFTNLLTPCLPLLMLVLTVPLTFHSQKEQECTE